MNFRLTAALFGIVAVIGVVLLILSFGDNEKKTTDVLAAEVAAVGTKAAENVDTVEFERADGSTLVIARTDKDRNTWQIQKPITAKADASKVMPVVNALLRAKPIPYGDLSSNPAVHGLDPAGLKVTIRQGAERSSTVNLGDVTFGGDKGVVFVTTSSQSKRPMAVRRSDLEALFRDSDKDGKAVDLAKWTSDFRTPGVFPADSRAMGEDVTFVKLTLPNKKKELALSRSSGGGWKFDSPAGWGEADTEGDPTGAPDKFTGVGPMLRALANVSALSPKDFIDDPKDLKEYGLNADNPDLIRIEMKTRDGQSVGVYFGTIDPGKVAPPPPPPLPGMPPHPPMGGTPGKVFVRVDGLPGVIQASATNLGNLAALIADPSPLRDRNLLNVGMGKQIDGLDLLLAGQPPDKPIKLRKVGGEWKLYGGPNDPQAADTAVASKIADVLAAKRTIKDFPAPNPANFPTIAETIYVWVDGFNPPIADKAEPTKKSEPVKLEFGRRDGETLYVKRTLPGGQPIEFAISASVNNLDVMQTVAKTRLDLLDQTLPSFSDTAVARITVSGQNNYVLAKDEKPDPITKEPLWRFVEPADKKGQIADAGQVREMLTLLATSQGSFGKFVDEGTGNPADFQLAPPRLKVTVGMGGKGDNDRVYEFGRDFADDKVYARFTGRPAIFTLQRRAMDRFAAPDLRDRVIFRTVPAALVNEVELTGWGGIKLKFEKNKDGVWVGPPGQTFVVDQAKLNAFIELLTRTAVRSFEKGTPEGKHGFGDPKQYLGVQLKWPGGAIALSIGAPTDAGATAYYCWSAWLDQKDPVVVIDGPLFKPYKDGPGGFAK